MTDNDMYKIAEKVGMAITQSAIVMLQRNKLTKYDISLNIINPIYNVLKNQHEADVEKAISFINDNTRKFSDIEDVKVQFKKYMEE